MIVAHLYGNNNIGIIYINLYSLHIGENNTADVTRDLGRGKWEFFIRALGIHLEGALSRKL